MSVASFPNKARTWKDPVATSTDLPTQNNSEGDVRLVLDTQTQYAWDGATWTAIGGGGGGITALTGDVTASGSGSVVATIANDAVTFAKMQNITTARLLGRATAGSGDTEEITLGTNLSFSGTTLNAAGGGGGGSPVSSGLPPLTGTAYKRAFVSGLASGDNIVYTAPAGKRAYINAFGVYNTSGGSLNFYPTWVISSTHYKFSGTLACGANASNQVATSVAIILEPGESFGINVSGTGMNGYARVVEYDNTTKVYAAKKYSSWSSGDNTIYTVPAATSAMLIDGVGMMAQNVTSLNYYNLSGGSRNIIWYNVESGGSVTSTRQVSATIAVANDAKSNAVQSMGMATGDFISLNTNSSSDTQFAWILVAEL